MLVYGDDEKIKTEMLAIFDLLNGKTSTTLYKSYIKFFKYVEYYHENEENILEIIMTERRGDKSTFTKHIQAALRINELLNCCPPGSYTEFDKISISYFRKIGFEHWNLVRGELGLKKHESNDWNKQLD